MRKPVLRVAAILVPLAFTACDQDPLGPDKTELRVRGAVTELLSGDPIAAARVLLEATTPDGATGVLGADSTDGAGVYEITLQIPAPCSAEDSISVRLQVDAADFLSYLRVGLDGGFRLACAPEPQFLDVHLQRVAYRTPQAVARVGMARHLSAGKDHACVVTDDGTWCWGRTDSGQLGNVGPSSTHAWEPVLVIGGHAFTRVAAGEGHTCAVDEEGRAWCWGRGGIGQLGPATLESSIQPVLVSDALRFVDVVAGRWHSCGLTPEGQVHCWGATRSTGAGIPGGVHDAQAEPVRVALDAPVRAISSVFAHTCAVTEAGEAWCWGYSYAGELGAAESQGDHFSPLRVSGDRAWRLVSAGEVYSCGVAADGSAWCWGRDGRGRLGAGVAAGDVGVPMPVASEEAFTAVTTGATQACGLATDGKAWCWGLNDEGQLGVSRDAFDPDNPTPVAVATDLRFTSLSAGGRSTCGITTAGMAVCWGRAADLGAGYGISAVGAPSGAP